MKCEPVAWGVVAPQAITPVCASGLPASLPQGKGHGNLSDFIKAIIPDTPQESTEPSGILSSPATADIAPAISGAIKGANINVIHDKKR